MQSAVCSNTSVLTSINIPTSSSLLLLTGGFSVLLTFVVVDINSVFSLTFVTFVAYPAVFQYA